LKGLLCGGGTMKDIKKKNKLKVIVFGGAGFVGSHVADFLSERGHDVIIFDIRESPYLKSNQIMIVGDILDRDAVDKAIKGCSVVYNFSGIADIDEAIKKPVETVSYNILGNTYIMDSCVANKVERFMYASSLYVYSDSGSFYRSSKQACELLLENYHKVYGLNYTIMRYGSLYGERSGENNFIHKILKEALVYGTITRDGDGEEIREYIHIYDAARCSVDALDNEYNNEIVIVTGSQQIKIKDLLDMIKEMMHDNVNIKYVESKSDCHYKITPYQFHPKIGRRMISSYYLDLGQGLLHCLSDLHKAHIKH